MMWKAVTCFDLCPLFNGQVSSAKDDRKASCSYQVHIVRQLHYTTLLDDNLASKTTTLRYCAHLQ